MIDELVAGSIFVAVSIYLYKRNVPQLLFWIIVTYLLTFNFFSIERTVAVLLGIAVAYAVCYFSTREHFDEEKKEEPSPSGKSTPHVDLGTTILHAYRNLSPEQIGGMKRDTKELMEGVMTQHRFRQTYCCPHLLA